MHIKIFLAALPFELKINPYQLLGWAIGWL